MNADGSEIRRLTREPDEVYAGLQVSEGLDASWSPDGTRIAFYRVSQTQARAIGFFLKPLRSLSSMWQRAPRERSDGPTSSSVGTTRDRAGRGHPMVAACWSCQGRDRAR